MKLLALAPGRLFLYMCSNLAQDDRCRNSCVGLVEVLDARDDRCRDSCALCCENLRKMPDVGILALGGPEVLGAQDVEIRPNLSSRFPTPVAP